MDWLLHNPIADMQGPLFILLYGAVIAVTLLICRLRVHRADSSRNLPSPVIPTELDPYETAFLRGGENEVLRLTILALIQRGYLRVTETPKSWRRASEERIEKAPDHPDPRHLTEHEGEIFRWFSGPAKPQAIFQSAALADHVQTYCRAYEARLQSDQLLTSRGTKRSAISVALLGALVIAGLGGYKLVVALSKGRSNVFFLIAMGVISLIVLVAFCRPQRLSSRGREYLDRLQIALNQLRERASSVASASADPSLLLLVSAFGIGVLAGTRYDFYPKMFKRSAAADGGSCSSWGSSCGGSSCGSSSCGGGGGCGGGCGGCGG